MIHGSDWEDIVVFLTKKEAKESSIKHPKSRVEIFGKKYDFNGYVPTYTYFENGGLFGN